ncbi:MAG: DNA-directed RNA polymerase subunit alpha [Defluviitaleaceae bacterium]|nr:DNA-directed RNA polymerase subunit alpha [Defluviitaleaceae bacterium]
MYKFEKPAIKILDKSSDGKYARFVIEPLEGGYGTTLGNSMRRTLLSSLPGFAITNVFIDGVVHQFSVLDNIKEDVIEIILNLKNVAIKGEIDPENRLSSYIAAIDFKGPGNVTAADIVMSPEFEIMNPDLHIATVAEGGSFRCELIIKYGRGYVSAEKNKLEESDKLAYIPVDSIYTPVSRVNFSIEDTRVAGTTDYDKLTLELWTNATLIPEKAVSFAASVLTEHLDIFMDLTGSVKVTDIMIEKEESTKDKVMDLTIEEMDLSVRSYNCLKRAGINHVQDLTSKTQDEMLKIRNLGRKSFEEVINKIRDLGLALMEDPEE